MGRSWFYLSFYHETPPEFTSEFDVIVGPTDASTVQVMRYADTNAVVDNEDVMTADIEKTFATGVMVDRLTEVTHCIASKW